MKSQVLLTVWCNISGEAAGEIWHWSLSGVKGLRSTPCLCNVIFLLNTADATSFKYERDYFNLRAASTSVRLTQSVTELAQTVQWFYAQCSWVVGQFGIWKVGWDWKRTHQVLSWWCCQGKTRTTETACRAPTGRASPWTPRKESNPTA